MATIRLAVSATSKSILRRWQLPNKISPINDSLCTRRSSASLSTTFLRPKPVVSARWLAGTAGSAGLLAVAFQHQSVRSKAHLEEMMDGKCTDGLVLETNEGENETQSFLHRIIQWIIDCWCASRDTVLVVIRGTEIALNLAPLLVLTPFSILLHPANDEPTVLANLTWNYLTRAVQRLGPSFVKLCQWMATRRDLFPPHICDRLSVLHEDGIPHSWSHSYKVLCEAFGEDFKSKGLSVGPDDVIGCGSAAQVYQGVLTVSNEKTGASEEELVAIKILHPNFAENVRRDLWLMDRIATFLHHLPFETIHMMNLPRAVGTFAGTLERQADLRLEAHNLDQFRDNFYEHMDEENSLIVFPSPKEGWVCKKVLVEDLVRANSVGSFLLDKSERGREARKDLAGPLCRAFFKMVFSDNFVHGDLHPGNIRVLRNAGGPDNPELKKLVFLDAGIAFSLCPNDRKNLQDLFRAVVLNEGEKAGRLMVERAKYERCSKMPGGVDAFAHGLQDIVTEFHDHLSFGSVRVGSLLNRVLDLCRVYGVEIDPAMSSVVVSVLILEGLARSLDPDLNLMDVAMPFVLGRGRV